MIPWAGEGAVHLRNHAKTSNVARFPSKITSNPFYTLKVTRNLPSVHIQEVPYLPRYGRELRNVDRSAHSIILP